MGIQIRIATIDDAQLISDLSKRTFYEAFHEQNTKEDMADFLATNFTLEGTIEEFDNGMNTFLLAYNNDEICGYANLRVCNRLDQFPALNPILLSRIYVLDKFIGEGVGKALMQRCIDMAIARGKNAICLGVWEHNPRAIAFYKKWGFEKIDEEVFILGSDVQTDWVMLKQL